MKEEQKICNTISFFFTLGTVFIIFLVFSILTLNNSNELKKDITNNKKCIIEKISVNNFQSCSDGYKNTKIFINYNSKIHSFYIECANSNTYYPGNQIPCFYRNVDMISIDKDIILKDINTSNIFSEILFVLCGVIVSCFSCMCYVSLCAYIFDCKFEDNNYNSNILDNSIHYDEDTENIKQKYNDVEI